VLPNGIVTRMDSLRSPVNLILPAHEENRGITQHDDWWCSRGLAGARVSVAAGTLRTPPPGISPVARTWPTSRGCGGGVPARPGPVSETPPTTSSSDEKTCRPQIVVRMGPVGWIFFFFFFFLLPAPCGVAR
jgi:hypothetical protein